MVPAHEVRSHCYLKIGSALAHTVANYGVG
jgi:hypothetical protein